MRQIAVFVVLVAMAVPGFGQETDAGDVASEATITHGEMAQLMLEALQTYHGSLPDPALALEQVKRYGIVPVDWTVDAFLTRGELAGLAGRLGVEYVPVDRDALVSRAFAVVIIRRGLARLQDYMARRMGHGFSTSHVLDLGVDRAVRRGDGVSPSDF